MVDGERQSLDLMVVFDLGARCFSLLLIGLFGGFDGLREAES